MEILFFSAAFFSEVFGTIAGFGSSTIFLPIALIFFDFKSALILVAFLHIFGNIGRIGFFRHGLDKKILLTFGAPSIVFTLAGALLVSYISQEILKGILGIFLITYSILFLTGEDFKIKAYNFSFRRRIVWIFSRAYWNRRRFNRRFFNSFWIT